MKLEFLSALVLPVLAFAGTTTQPATAPAVDPVAAFHRGTALLLQGNLTDAQTILSQADRSYGKSLRITDSQQAEIVYAMAVGSMLQNDYPKAHQSLERVRPEKAKDGDFILNDAKVNIAIKNFNMLAVKELDTYLGSAAPDEQAIDLFGAAIDKAKTNGVNSFALTQYVNDYTRYNAALEQTRPGQHHWGQQWISGAEWSSIDYQVRTKQRAIDSASSDLASAQSRLESAQSNYNAANTQIAQAPNQRTWDSNTWRLSRTVTSSSPIASNGDSSAVDRAAADVQQCKDRLASLQSQMPHPLWSADMKPIVPDNWSGQNVADAAPVVAPAPPPDDAPTLQATLQKMSAEAGPAAGTPWNQLNIDLSKKWLQSNVISKPIAITAYFKTGNLRADGSVEITCSREGFSAGELTVSSVRVAALLTASQTAKAAKLVAGKAVSIVGTTDNLTMTNPPDNPGDVLIDAQLSNAVIIQP